MIVLFRVRPEPCGFSFEALESRTLLSTIIVTSAADSGAGSLRSAISASAIGDTIAFAGSLAGQTITLASALPVLSKDGITITGAAAPGLAISGNNQFTIFTVAALTTINLDSLILTHGFSSTNGAGITFTTGNVNFPSPVASTISNVMFSMNNATRDGGAIYFIPNGNSQNHTLQLTNDTFDQNSARYGPAVDAASPVVATGTTFSNNTATQGGAVVMNNGNTNATFSNDTFTHNTGAIGGAIYLFGAVTTIDHSTFSNNSSTQEGGAIFTEGTLTISNSTFTSNSTSGGFGGGAIFDQATASFQALTVTDSTFSGNQATASGTFVSPINSQVINTYGGGAINASPSPLVIARDLFVGNSSASLMGGGAILALSSSSVDISNSTFASNTTATTGGAIALALDQQSDAAGTAAITNVTINGNSGATGGGVAVGTGASVSLENTIVANSTNGNLAAAGTVNSLGHNISSDTTGTAFLTAASDLNNISPNLGALASNGGPTQTELPNTGSPALNAGTTTGITATTDQRGLPRIMNGLIDIGATEGAAAMDPNQCFTEDLYIKLLGRAGSSADVAFWTGLLDSDTLTATQVAFQFENSVENRTNQVKAAYIRFLHRPADAPSLAIDVADLRSGLITEGQLYQIMLNSNEYETTHVMDAAFIGGVIQDTLMRPASGTDLTNFQIYLATNSRASLSALIVNSVEDRNNIVSAQYLKFLNRPADPAGLAVHSAFLASTNLNIALEESAFLRSPEFLTLAIADCVS